MSLSQRITVTQKGRELQEQLREQNRQPQKPALVKENQDSLAHFFDKELKAQDQLNSYASLIQNRLKSPEQIIEFLETKFQKQPLFVQKEMQKVGQRIFHYGNREIHSQAVLPQLDFRQKQYMKNKYANYSENLSSRQSRHQVEEGLTKKVNFMLFQEGKIERMITKYEKFNEKAKLIPQYKKDDKKGEDFMKQLLQRMDAGQETRVESLQEIRQQHQAELSLLEYQNLQQERLRQTMSDLHKSKYGRYWNKLKLSSRTDK
ncbi:unnamed protein product [Paramecium primaurelia]|uniref:Uncharacterized protein n=2 Tax=Paramecium TaxID=5884 RepID=A0A8S1SP81_9CILI|nr:unnamed protein product [Paramecium primaurelia]CAD8140212.1 unnamed protein product [Paramecium pentaurelia]